MKKWEWHFRKLQYGQSLDVNNLNVTKNSKNENCNKNYKKTMLVHRTTNQITDKEHIRWTNVQKHGQKNAGHSHTNNKNKFKKTRDDQKYSNISKFFHETLNTKTRKKIVKICLFVTKNIFGVRIMRTSPI